MKGKLTALLMAACLVASSMAACGNSESSGNDAPAADSAAGDTAAAGDSAAAGGESEAAGDDAAAPEDIAEIKMTYLSMGPLPADLQLVEDEINKISEAEIGVHVTLEMLEPANFAQQVNLKMSSAEPFDLLCSMPSGTASFNNMASQKQLMDISDLLEEYGQDILDTVGDLMKATTVNGSIYGVPTWRSLVTSTYIVMRTDVLEDLGLLEKAQNMTSFAEYEEILQAVKDSEKWNYLAGIVASDLVGTCLPMGGCYMGEENFADFTTYDQLGDTNKMIAINPDGSDNTVINNFETEEYHKMYEKMKEWYDKGYVYGDVTTQTDKAEEMVKSNVAFSYFSQSEIGIESSKEATCGMPMTCVKLVTMPISTSTCNKFVWSVPTTSKEPEAAIKFLNMMYTDSRICNLLAWGIEGTHYQVKDGVAYFLDGQDANTCTYHTCDFIYGNQFLVLPWDGQSADFRDIALEEMENAETSVYLGFACDTTNISGEISAVSNVISEFLPSIDSGVAAQEDYDAFLEKLNTSGMDKILAEYQTQLDAWLEAQGQ